MVISSLDLKERVQIKSDFDQIDLHFEKFQILMPFFCFFKHSIMELPLNIDKKRANQHTKYRNKYKIE